MQIALTIYKWAIFQLDIFFPSREDDLDFTYFGLGFLFFYVTISKYLGRIIFQVSLFGEFTDDPIIYEKILKESKDNK